MIRAFDQSYLYFLHYFLQSEQGSNKLRNRIDVSDVIRFVSMTSLGSRAAPDCRTGQSKGRYCARLQSYSLVYFFLGYILGNYQPIGNLVWALVKPFQEQQLGHDSSIHFFPTLIVPLVCIVYNSEIFQLLYSATGNQKWFEFQVALCCSKSEKTNILFKDISE